VPRGGRRPAQAALLLLPLRWLCGAARALRQPTGQYRPPLAAGCSPLARRRRHGRGLAALAPHAPQQSGWSCSPVHAPTSGVAYSPAVAAVGKQAAARHDGARMRSQPSGGAGCTCTQKEGGTGNSARYPPGEHSFVHPCTRFTGGVCKLVYNPVWRWDNSCPRGQVRIVHSSVDNLPLTAADKHATCRQQAAGSRQQAAGSRQQAAGSRQQAAGSRQ
jgi:hypothetical protein